MQQRKITQETFIQLRSQAEELITKKKSVNSQTALVDPAKLIHELQTFQIELELQNSELHRSQKELMQSKIRYTELYDFAPVGYVTLNDKGLILNANLTLADMLSTERSRLLNQLLSMYIFSEDQDIYYQHLRHLSHTKTRQVCELRLKTADGKPFDVQMESTFIEYQTTKPGQYRTVISDISARKQLEKEREDLQTRLHQVHKMESISTISGGIAHDFNNILSIIMGNVDLAGKDIPEWNPAQSKLEVIRKASLRAAGIVKTLLSFNRITDGDQRSTNPVFVIKNALSFLRASIPATIEIHTVFSDEEMSMLSDPVQIGQILINLCTNASQAMEETGGILEIKVETEFLTEASATDYPGLSVGEHVKITVKNNGPGIDPKIIGRIFDPYFTTRGMGNNSGMGLAVVHTLVKNHQGVITVKSNPGKGVAFTILFPMSDEKPEMKTNSPDEFLIGREAILFVDDEESIIEIAREALTQLGYRVEAMSSPEDALALFKLNPGYFDVVITDMTMPKMTGITLAEKLFKIRPDIPVIICTGYSPLIDGEKAGQLGFAGYLTKPVTMSRIALAIRKIIDQPAEKDLAGQYTSDVNGANKVNNNIIVE